MYTNRVKCVLRLNNLLLCGEFLLELLLLLPQRLLLRQLLKLVLVKHAPLRLHRLDVAQLLLHVPQLRLSTTHSFQTFFCTLSAVSSAGAGFALTEAKIASIMFTLLSGAAGGVCFFCGFLFPRLLDGALALTPFPAPTSFRAPRDLRLRPPCS